MQEKEKWKSYRKRWISLQTSMHNAKKVWNYEADRLQILFDSIPDDQKRKELKSYGFKWSPKYKAWQRQLTQNAVYAVKRVLNLQNL